jgi:hypothetical protein
MGRNLQSGYAYDQTKLCDQQTDNLRVITIMCNPINISLLHVDRSCSRRSEADLGTTNIGIYGERP